ncbi:hypothetical protein CDD83_6539 [Cordyceps sp. RAO-2017]|nr:hypothetical protein CDD83_6539 [Cordyceps sp. RAO-2017]
MAAQLGDPLPLGDEHAVSVSLPRWSDTEGWASRDPAVLARLQAGYPRFYVPHIVRLLGEKLVGWAAATPLSAAAQQRKQRLVSGPGQSNTLFPSERTARECRRYLASRDGGDGDEALVGVLRFGFQGLVEVVDGAPSACRPPPGRDVYAVLYPDRLAPEAKAFWQHTGFGISSRFAAFWLDNAGFLRKKGPAAPDGAVEASALQDGGRAATRSLRQRIARLYSTAPDNVGVQDVFLFPTGMSAISQAATALRSLPGRADGEYRVAVFGFLYVDTFKVLSKVHGFDCVLYGYASSADMDALEADLQSGMRINALFTEFPGNPLLGSLDLDRLYGLAKKHDFAVVVDDTVGTAVNLNLVPSCDVICTSLTKMFSGACNVMGGSLVLSPQSRRHGAIRAALADHDPDTYFPLDAAVMDRNSADFEERATAASRNASHMAAQLRRHSAVEAVFYPEGGPTQHLYDRFRRARGGYGYLLSIRFVKPAAAIAFHDALDVAKGPSLGTNFTLCCPYTLLAHYSELEWAAKYGVVEHLVRISVGVEKREVLEALVDRALAAAAECCD